MDSDVPLPPEGLTYYQLLGVEENAPESDIQKAYRQLIKVYHPDQLDHWAADDISRRISNAYKVLTNPRKRQEYNQVGHTEYTGEPLTSKADITEWVENVNDLINVQHQLTIDDLQGEVTEETVDLEGEEFEEADESLSIDEIFEEIDVDIGTDEIYEDVAQETRKEDKKNTDEPEYLDSKSLTDIGESNESNEEEQENDNSSKSQGNQRVQDYTKITQDNEPEDYEEKKEQIRNEIQEEKESTIENITGKFIDTITRLNDLLGGDIVSKAVRRSWIVRLSGVLFLLAIFVAFGTLTNVSLLPTTDSFIDPTSELFGIIAISIIVVFLVDQLKVEQETERGYINTNTSPFKFLIPTAIVNVIVVGIVSYSIFIEEVNIVDNFFLLINNEELNQVFASGVVEEGITIAITLLMLIAFILTVITASRIVWHYRYCGNVRILPLPWDSTLAFFIFAYVIVLISTPSVVEVPTLVSDTLLVMPESTMEVIGVMEGSITGPGIVVLSYIFSLIVLVTVGVRIGVEQLIKKYLN